MSLMPRRLGQLSLCIAPHLQCWLRVLDRCRQVARYTSDIIKGTLMVNYSAPVQAPAYWENERGWIRLHMAEQHIWSLYHGAL